MKVLQVVGYSGSGKTTFIEQLIAQLTPLGSVGVIKHLGDHPFTLEAGKDTTRFFETGATISAGIDQEKTVLAIHEHRLIETLTLFANAGIQFAIVEGFKTVPYPKIVLGDLSSEPCVLRNPTPGDVIASLDRFSDFYTMEGVVRELKRDHDLRRAGAILTFNGIVREWTGDQQTKYLDFENEIDQKIQALKERMEQIDGILGVRFYHKKGRVFPGEGITYIAVLAEHRKEALWAVSEALDELKQDIHKHLPGS